MPDVDTSIYKTQPNPLGSAQGVFNLLNTAAQNQLLNTATQQRALELQQSQANDLRSTAGSLVNNPGLTPAQVKAAIADRARQLQINPNSPVVSTMMQRYDGNDWMDNLKLDASSAVGPAGLSSRFEYKNPQTGATQNVPLPATFGRGFQTTNPPGYEEVARGPAGASGINDLLSMRDNAPNQKALLENLNDLSSEAVSGPSADWEKRANALVQRLFPGSKLTLTPQQLASSEEYGKISEQLAGQQATAAHATNAFLTNAYATNPGLYLSKIGRQGITHMLQGNVDSIVAKANAWTEANKSPAEFAAWNKDFNKDFNPRVFQYARMTPEERSKFRSTLPVNQQKKFFDQIQSYQAKGWIDLGG